LLKILSKITEPTTGRIEINGRVSSLLEVGTGFHPELTGRENIFLNGTILGMKRIEIKEKFDEIVAFSGIEKFIDTPVKRYSSGMYVRLAFAVAAHLEPEILIIDEVLAVGDTEFQKKCLGKMDQVSKQDGRTILFVSHNMTAISTLCNSGVLLKNGTTTKGKVTIGEALKDYSLQLGNGNKITTSWDTPIGNEEVLLKKIYISSNLDHFYTDKCVNIVIELEVFKDISNLLIGIHLHSSRGYEIGFSGIFDDIIDEEGLSQDYIIKKGIYTYQITIPENTLAAGSYKVYPNIGIYNIKSIVFNEAYIEFELINANGLGRKFVAGAGLEDIFRPDWKWNLIN